MDSGNCFKFNQAADELKKTQSALFNINVTQLVCVLPEKLLIYDFNLEDIKCVSQPPAVSGRLSFGPDWLWTGLMKPRTFTSIQQAKLNGTSIQLLDRTYTGGHRKVLHVSHSSFIDGQKLLLGCGTFFQVWEIAFKPPVSSKLIYQGDLPGTEYC